jgi:PilZ domain
MSLALTMPKDRKNVVERAKAERRHFLRVRLELAGRFFLPSDNREAECKIVDLSPGGAQITSETVPGEDAQIILYVDGFGRLEGNVTRPSEGSFGVNFHCSAAKRDKIAEQLTLYMNRDVVDEASMRRHDRAPTKGLARFTRANGEILSCEVLDLSLSGVSLKTDARPPMGEIVLIGQSAGRVVRHHENGIAIEFVSPQHEKASGEQPANPFLVVR